MAFLDELKKLTRPYDEDDEYLDDEYDNGEEEFESEPQPKAPQYDDALRSKSVFSKREPKAPAPVPERSKMKLVLANPESFEEARGIADNLREKRAVLMNLEQATKDTQRRLLDFLSGVVYALGGEIKRVSAQAYILTPTNVALVGDSIDDFEASGLYF